MKFLTITFLLLIALNALAQDGAGGIAGGSGDKKKSTTITLDDLTHYQKVAFGIKSIEEQASQYSIYKSFNFQSRRLKHIISFHKSYERGDGLYTRTQQRLINFRNVFIDKYRTNPIIKSDPVLKSIVNYGDELMEISLRDYTLKNHSNRKVLDLVGEKEIDYRHAAQTALTLYLFCNWNEEYCQ